MSHDENKPIKVLEFYSGIGGMHYALKRSGIKYDVIGAFDINTNANEVYKYNFPDVRLMQKNLEGLTVVDLDKWAAQCWTMSPPCQPYTRQGKQEASKDARAKSFLHILDLFSQMKTPPTYILIENVKGFDVSDTRKHLLETLRSRGYSIQEFLISPVELGVPNSRLRYYLLAKLNGDKNKSLNENLEFENIESKSISHYLNENDESFDEGSSLISDNVLQRFWKIMDIVHEDSIGSCCFTKAYGKYIEGTGSIFTKISKSQAEEIFKKIKSLPEGQNEEQFQLLRSLKLRYFTPIEISKLLCFPDDFSFPDKMTVRQRYQLLGNSVNVYTIGYLMKEYLFI
ncbi:tRNA (cytosine(38)-C(5))-methyltransferase-like [Clytia hemisphaerica]|uniref:tRNA (cytosine(38)-C(5))-methyltransferase-like n=1 Tax=Clytia hemisphaerica TaxID=252671 RepID=UPI0034D44465